MDHERRIDCGQRAVGVFGEVLVPGRIEQIHDALAIRELHHRRGDRDAALLLEAHPVRGGVARRFAPLDGSGHLDRPAEQQQFFGERCLAGVRVRNDRESPASPDFGGGICIGHGSGRRLRGRNGIRSALRALARRARARGVPGVEVEAVDDRVSRPPTAW